MPIQLATNETSFSPLFGTGLMFETDGKKIDPPEGQGGGTVAPPPPPPEDEEETPD